jgi:hypothetical protein
MIANLMISAFTFRRCTAEKMIFLWLNLIDLGLTIFAVSAGLTELNPVVRQMLVSPYQAYTAKIGIPLLLTWAVPGKLLLPGIVLLALIIGWDIKELIVFFS